MRNIKSEKIKPLPRCLRIPINRCKRCTLSDTREHICHGSGPGTKGSLVFVGEAPGASEDRTGIVFCGQSGNYFNKILNMFKISRNQVTVLNILKCRPPLNRKPNAKETKACIPFLHNQISIIEPKLIVALGRISFYSLTGFYDRKLCDFHGDLFPYKKDKKINVLFTFHPSFLLRPGGITRRKDFLIDIKKALILGGLK